MRGLQTALGLVAAETGVCVSPIIVGTRKGEKSSDIALILRLVREIYRMEGIAFSE